jgi:hypothetical protein
MKLNFRVISKLCFLLVIIGFLMPMSCDMNGFQLADSGMVDSSLTYALYALFCLAVLGFILGVVLFLKIKIPVVVDCIIIVACMCCGLIPFFQNLGGDYSYQTGVYVILGGYAAILITQIISLIKKEA